MTVKWAYGVTTVPERLNDLLPRTLRSLASGGFELPRIFIDGLKEQDIPSHLSAYEVTCRYPKVRTFGAWMLAALELFLREPHADRYATFQDETYRGSSSPAPASRKPRGTHGGCGRSRSHPGR